MKKKILTAVLCGVMAFTACLGFAACGETELSGYDIDLARSFAEANNLEVVFRLIDWGNKEMELESGRSDLVWNGLTVTAARAEAMELSINYLLNKQAVVVRAADVEKYNTREKLASAKLIAEIESAGADEIAKFKSSVRKTVKSQRDALLEVKTSHSDAAVIDLTMANYLTKTEGSEFTDLAIIEAIEFEEEHYAVAAKKGNVGLITKVNEFFSSIFTDGSMRATAEKYALTSLLETSFTAPKSYDSLTDAEKASWESVVEKGTLVVAYTVNPPIAIA